jgi:glycosyltransferase involved in cell wall biosynthesis
VSDNASEPSLQSSIEFIRDQTGADIKYYRNINNLGAERNFFLAVQRASGDYVVIFGSDDVLTPEALDRFCVLALERFDWIFLNLETIVAGSIIRNESIKVSMRTECVGCESIILQFGTETNFISSSCFNRERYLKFYIDNLKTIGEFHTTGWSYYFCLLAAMGDDGRFVFIPDTYIRRNEGSHDIWYNHTDYFFYGMPLMLDGLHKYVSTWSISKAKGMHLRRFYFIGHRLPVIKIIKAFPLYKNVMWYYLMLFVCIFPRELLKLINGLKTKLICLKERLS